MLFCVHKHANALQIINVNFCRIYLQEYHSTEGVKKSMWEIFRFSSKTELRFKLWTSTELKKKKKKERVNLIQHWKNVGNGVPNMDGPSLYSTAEEEGLVPEQMVILTSSCGGISALMSI